MTDLDQRMFVTCPASAARLHLTEFSRSQGQLALRAPVMLPALETEIVLQRDVVVTVSAAGEGEDGASLRVAWQPAGGGPFPRFVGTLRVEGDDLENCCLVLQGNCAPTSASLSRSSEVALGHRIAVSTARMLLREIRASLERSQRQSERGKHAPSNPHP